jgi:type VI secretion system protein ImpK
MARESKEQILVTDTATANAEWVDKFQLHDDPSASDKQALGGAQQLNSASVPAPKNLVERLERIKQAKNPFLEASQVLLRSLADMPQNLPSEQDVVALHSMLSMEVEAYTKLCEQANLRRDHMLVVRYALCTALDEAAGRTKWGRGQYQGQAGEDYIDVSALGNEESSDLSQEDNTNAGMAVGIWSTQSLLQKFHKEGYGGYKVFLLIGRLASEPAEHAPVLEVMLQLLHLGFEGDYHTKADGKRTLESVRNKLFTQLASYREAAPKELSPHWRGVEGKFKMLRSIPVWVTASLLGLLLFAMFAWYKYVLTSKSSNIEAQIDTIAKLQVSAAAPGPTKLRELLAVETAQNLVTVEEQGGVTQVIFPGDKMFAPAQAEISESVSKVLVRVAQELKTVGGEVEVVGHSDNSVSRKISNQELSELRAQAVASALLSAGVAPNRVTSLGKGDSEPVADNKTVQGRAKNRRVTLTIINVPKP